MRIIIKMGHKFTIPLQTSNRLIVSIIGLHKARVLSALYNGALYKAPKFDMQPAIRQRATQRKTTPFVRQVIANQLIKEKSQYGDHPRYKFGTIDLGDGPRELAIDLSNYEIDVSEYNALHGDGAAQQVISDLYHNNDHNKNNHPRDEEKECPSASDDILFKHKNSKKYENNPEKTFLKHLSICLIQA